MQRVLCVCVRDEKSWNIESKDTKNIYFLIKKILKHLTKSNKRLIFNLFLSLICHLRIFQFSLQRMWLLAEPHAFPLEVSTFIYIYIDVFSSHIHFYCKICFVFIKVLDHSYFEYFISSIDHFLLTLVDNVITYCRGSSPSNQYWHT